MILKIKLRPVINGKYKDLVTIKGKTGTASKPNFTIQENNFLVSIILIRLE